MGHILDLGRIGVISFLKDQDNEEGEKSLSQEGQPYLTLAGTIQNFDYGFLLPTFCMTFPSIFWKKHLSKGVSLWPPQAMSSFKNTFEQKV